MNPSPTLYLLSGNGSIRAWWDDTLPFFTQQRPVPIELPGFGDNDSGQYQSLAQLADALIGMTERGSEIFAVGVNGLVVLHALVREPEHFSKVSLLAPVGAFLWERRFVKLMSPRPVRSFIHFLLSHFPRLFRRKFSAKTWTQAQYARMGEGYRKCRAFTTYFDIVQPENALDLFDRITAPIELIWGTRDAVLGVDQAAAWDSILPRAALTITLKPDWGHYPYIDNPAGFAAWMEAHTAGFRAHGKGGRLRLAQLAGLPVPALYTVSQIGDFDPIESELRASRLYALRSSNLHEDHIDHSQAGLNTTLLRVRKQDIRPQLAHMFEEGMAEVVIQEFVQPLVSGVAFVRHISAEIEWVEGHLEALLEGKQPGNRLICSKMGGEWTTPASRELAAGLRTQQLEAFLQRCIRAFHYVHADIEWAWDGQQFHLLQLRPVTAYGWRRCLTSANLDEILPRQVSRAMEHAQRLAAPYIGTVISRWDPRVLNDNEPFSVTYADASYINSDLFLSRFCDWGLPSSMYAGEIGGAVPALPFRLGRFVRSLPRFLRMGFATRRSLDQIEPQLTSFVDELDRLYREEAVRDTEAQEAALMRWFVRYYLFIVRTNILINSAISSSFGSFFGKGDTVYQNLDHKASPHRLPYESDPATPRPGQEPLPLTAFPTWNAAIRLLHRLGMPGLRGKYTEVREWFRDNNMRLFYRLHHELKDSAWLEPYPSQRTQAGTFWQDGGPAVQQDFSFVIYPGSVRGILGQDILLVDALEPGHFEQYRQAQAVISRTGGRLSHGATLLRELKKPAAVMSKVEDAWIGKQVLYADGKIEVAEETVAG